MCESIDLYFVDEFHQLVENVAHSSGLCCFSFDCAVSLIYQSPDGLKYVVFSHREAIKSMFVCSNTVNDV